MSDLCPTPAISTYYTQQNEVTSTDNLDFRHHSYKDMRQVSPGYSVVFPRPATTSPQSAWVTPTPFPRCSS